MDRIIEALKTLGGSGTAQEVRQVVGGPAANVSAHLSVLKSKDLVFKSGTKSIVVNRWIGGKRRIDAAIWSVK